MDASAALTELLATSTEVVEAVVTGPAGFVKSISDTKYFAHGEEALRAERICSGDI